MSATRPSRSGGSELPTTDPLDYVRPAGMDPAVDPSSQAPPADISTLRARRRAARRRSRLARLDVTIGVIAAIVLLVASPGLAITAVIALGVLAVCLAWVAVERLRRARRAGRQRARTRHR